MAALEPGSWHDFFAVTGTAAAALLGLVLVAVSLIAGRGPGIYLIAAALVLTLAPMLFSIWGLLFAPELGRR